ncbi:hypothetical protein THAOC_10262 [Thalassiosira oceanica]|uniref:Uncharacterized protein n=1 Tax=Thalassiosira oceanica TaxID=159749 RepID=K0TDD9_THAOC|nr:hypothetical protein THAOC_10262 [Thalassiosira oceanica]|eukprot:EJK68547.1 hypothetical protein THAOC_10262 [Thalassiosira oceanica]
MIASAMSKRSCRAAGGLQRPSERRALPTFPSTIYLMIVCRPDEPTDFSRSFSPQCNAVRKVRRPRPEPPESKESGRPPRVDRDGILRYRLGAFLFLASWATTVRTMPTSRSKLLRGRDDMEEFHLRRREADGPNPRIPAVGAMVSGSLVHHQAAEIRRRKSVGSARRARIVKVDSRP